MNDFNQRLMFAFVEPQHIVISKTQCFIFIFISDDGSKDKENEKMNCAVKIFWET